MERVGTLTCAGNRAGSWVALEELHAQGKLRAIGVSNYTPAHMKTLLQSCKTPPALLQVRQTDELSHLRGETVRVDLKTIFTVWSLGHTVVQKYRRG